MDSGLDIFKNCESEFSLKFRLDILGGYLEP